MSEFARVVAELFDLEAEEVSENADKAFRDIVELYVFSLLIDLPIEYSVDDLKARIEAVTVAVVEAEKTNPVELSMARWRCSAYCLGAMLLEEAKPHVLEGWRWRLVATDRNAENGRKHVKAWSERIASKFFEEG